MPTPQHVLKESKERFNSPAVLVDQGDDLRGDIQDVRGDQDRISLLGSSAPGLAAPLATRQDCRA